MCWVLDIGLECFGFRVVRLNVGVMIVFFLGILCMGFLLFFVLFLFGIVRFIIFCVWEVVNFFVFFCDIGDIFILDGFFIFVCVGVFCVDCLILLKLIDFKCLFGVFGVSFWLICVLGVLMKFFFGFLFNIFFDRDLVVFFGVFLLKFVLFFCGEFIKFLLLLLLDIFVLFFRIDKDDLLENDVILSLLGLRFFFFGEMFFIVILKFLFENN